MTALLEIKDLHVAYGKVEAVRGVGLTMQPGQIVTVIGPNGAGKTTLLAAAAGLLRSRGQVIYDGANLERLDVEERVQCGFCLVPETRELFGDMTVADNLLLGAYTRRRNGADVKQSLQHVYGRFPRLAERRRQKAQTLSGGERQMLALGRALMSEPRLLMLDEPSLGLAPTVVEALYDTLAELHRQGLTLLLAEQSIPLALGIADYAYVLQTGRIALEGPAAELEKNEQVREIYLGISTPAAAG